MAKVFSIRMLELRPGVTAAEFEQFMADEGLQFPELPGEEAYLLKGDRGERNSKYLMLTEYERIEDRDRLYPSATEEMGENLQRQQTYQALLEKLVTFVDISGFTDYVEIGQFGRT